MILPCSSLTLHCARRHPLGFLCLADVFAMPLSRVNLGVVVMLRD